MGGGGGGGGGEEMLVSYPNPDFHSSGWITSPLLFAIHSMRHNHHYAAFAAIELFFAIEHYSKERFHRGMYRFVGRCSVACRNGHMQCARHLFY